MKILCCFISLLLALNVFAQDANYWQLSYGAGGYFMPGSVIAANGDSGVLFVNPALLAHSRKASATITGTLYRQEMYRIKDAVGKGFPMNASHGAIVPLIASHSIPFHLKLPVTLVYGIINRPVINYISNQRRESMIDALDNSYSPGPEEFIGQYSLSNSSSETSGILSAGLAVNDHFSIGLTAEGQFRKTNYAGDYRLRALQNTNDNEDVFPPVVSVTQRYESSFSAIGARLKLGIAYDKQANHFGLMVSSPLLHLHGNASVLSDLQINDLQIVPGASLSLLASSRQTKLKSRWKAPLSAAAGYTRDLGRGQVYVALEYFAKLKEYNVITPRNEAFLRPDTSTRVTSNLLKMKDARQQVLNFSVGGSYLLREKIRAYLSVRSDYTYANRNLYANTDGFDVNMFNINIYHAQLGVNLQKTKYNLRTGLLLSYGKTNQHHQDMNFEDPKDSNFLMGTPGVTRASYQSIGLLFSYIYNF